MRKRVEEAGVIPPFTFFDFTTAMALLYFKQKMVDLAVLEVGLGGRLDSTNVVDPLLSIITNIGKDHEEQLGRSLLKIAGEKAGIIKKGRPLLTAATQPRCFVFFQRSVGRKGRLTTGLERNSGTFRMERGILTTKASIESCGISL